MKLVLYSGGYAEENQVLDQEFLRLLARRKQARIVFIPAEQSGALAEFAELKERFASYDGLHLEYFLLEESYTKQDLNRVFKSDAIYLGGGNTFYFLQLLREHGLLARLRRYARSGGILLGLSAGAILFTPKIDTAAVPSHECDENDVDLEDWEALNLVPFEFSPHYRARKKSDEELLKHSQKIPHPIYACRDGAGIIVRGKKLSFVGPVTVFFKGEKYSLN